MGDHGDGFGLSRSAIGIGAGVGHDALGSAGGRGRLYALAPGVGVGRLAAGIKLVNLESCGAGTAFVRSPAGRIEAEIANGIIADIPNAA